MPETKPVSTHVHNTRSHAHRRSLTPKSQTSYLEPVLYFSGAILLLIIAKLLRLQMLSLSFGAMGVVILSVSKILKFKPGIVLSSISIIIMAMFWIWEWVNTLIISILSGDITANPALFKSTLIEGLILTVIAWAYHKLLNSIHIRMTQKWFVKKSYVITFKLIFFSMFSLVVFWIAAKLGLAAQPVTQLNIQDSVLIAGAFTMLITGIPAIIFLAKHSDDDTKRHRHHRHHRHGSSRPEKSAEAEQE